MRHGQVSLEGCGGDGDVVPETSARQLHCGDALLVKEGWVSLRTTSRARNFSAGACACKNELAAFALNQRPVVMKLARGVVSVMEPARRGQATDDGRGMCACIQEEGYLLEN